ncbi:hypothetical protein [Methylobacterium sp. Leaf89]|uniref:hypothetical protein n=1 Tax=Methylobacterium sp. Leaf89 TaxID=1736245 RepID=UPI0007009AD8|nr:hypothetical protein [Methylobacterium sp. Leaf89]KQO73453.1 hypothetical protein ASF18_16815 [Methylobacterium sp. Leaf89]
MLDNHTRDLLDSLAGKLLRSLDLHTEAGDDDAALITSDAADSLLALLDLDGLRQRAVQAG